MAVRPARQSMESAMSPLATVLYVVGVILVIFSLAVYGMLQL